MIKSSRPDHLRTLAYLGFIDEQQQKDSQLLEGLVHLAEFLQLQSLAHACKMVLRKHLNELDETSEPEVRFAWLG